jgi:tetratricopeptide (TPR) repeat protein
MFKLLKMFFSGLNRYSLSISKIYKKESVLYCAISDKMNINPFFIKASDILKNDKLLLKIHPKALLNLMDIYNQSKPPLIHVSESTNTNTYGLDYHGKKFSVTGKAICQDIDLLKSMRSEDVFRIAYQTGYQEAITHYKKSLELNADEIEVLKNKPNNILQLPNQP